MPKPPPDNSKLLLQYAGLGAQLLVSLGLAVYVGLKLDEKFHFSFPILVWSLPLIGRLSFPSSLSILRLAAFLSQAETGWIESMPTVMY